MVRVELSYVIVDSVKEVSAVLKRVHSGNVMAPAVVLQQISVALRIINICFSVQLSVGASPVKGITQMWRCTNMLYKLH
jgi:hypothetical protein